MSALVIDFMSRHMRRVVAVVIRRSEDGLQVFDLTADGQWNYQGALTGGDAYRRADRHAYAHGVEVWWDRTPAELGGGRP